MTKAGLDALKPGAGPLVALTLRLVVCAVILLIALSLIGRTQTLFTMGKKAALLIVAGGIIGNLLGSWAYFSALARDEASRITPLTSTYPLVALVIGILVLGEKITVFKVVGALAIVLGLILLGITPRRL